MFRNQNIFYVIFKMKKSGAIYNLYVRGKLNPK